MATPQVSTKNFNVSIEEVEQVVASHEIPSSPVSGPATPAAEESQEKKSYARGYNGKSSPSPIIEPSSTSCFVGALKDMPAAPGTEEPEASRSTSTSSTGSLPAAVVEAGDESEENKSYVRGYNG